MLPQKPKLAILGCTALILLTSQPVLGQQDQVPIAVIEDNDGLAGSLLFAKVSTALENTDGYTVTQREDAFVVVHLTTKDHPQEMEGEFYVLIISMNLGLHKSIDAYTPSYIDHRTGFTTLDSVNSDSDDIIRYIDKILETVAKQYPKRE